MNLVKPELKSVMIPATLKLKGAIWELTSLIIKKKSELLPGLVKSLFLRFPYSGGKQLSTDRYDL